MNDTKRKGGAGKFFLGLFIGILLTIGLIAGGLALVYYKVSLNTFHVSVGNDKIESYTPNDLVKLIQRTMKNKNEVSLKDLGDDLGLSIPLDIHGVNIEDIVSSPIMDITETVKSKVRTLSASEIDGLLSFDKLDGVFNGKTTFVLKNGQLYKDGSDEAENFTFDVDMANKTLTMKGEEYTLSDDNKVEIDGLHLPLTFVLGDVTNKTVGEILNFKEQNGQLVDSTGKAVTGIMKVISEFAIKELSSKINTMPLSDLFGYVEKEGRYYENSDASDPLPQILQTLASTNIEDLGETMKNLTITKILDKEQYSKGALSLLEESTLETTTLENLPKELGDAFFNAKLSDLVDKGPTNQLLKDMKISEIINKLPEYASKITQ